MNEERLESIVSFTSKLRAHLSDVHPEDGARVPHARLLDRFVEIGFYASLHEEEGRRTDLTIAWVDGVKRCAHVVELGAPVAMTPKTIAKLAPAARRASTSLAVRADGDELVIWALLQHGAPVDQPLTMRSLAAGVLRVDYRGVPHALYARGETLFLGRDHEVRAPAQRLTEAFACWSQSARPPLHIDGRAAVVTRLATQMLEGHGGMMLLVPKEEEPVGVRMHYATGRGGDILAARYASESDQGERFDHAIDFVASLTATDNALLLDTELRVRGFGVQVIEGEAPLQQFTHRNPYTGDCHVDDISTFKGTRHPAGVIFCLRQPREAAAIIASADGRLSLVVKDAAGAVEVLGAYERGFGWR